VDLSYDKLQANSKNFGKMSCRVDKQLFKTNVNLFSAAVFEKKNACGVVCEDCWDSLLRLKEWKNQIPDNVGK